MTLLELIIMSLKDIGAYNIGATLDDEEAQDAVKALNVMVSMWAAEGLDVYAITKESFTLTANKGSYTWGISTPASDFNSARPVRLLTGYIRDSANSDYPIDIVSDAQFNSIPEKADKGRPYCLYYNPTYPVSMVYPYYVPDTTYTLYLDTEKSLTTFSTLTATIVLPPEYLAALRWNLDAELCPSYKKPVSPKIEERARHSLEVIKRLNAGNKLKPVKLNQFPGSANPSFWRVGDIRSGEPYY